MFSSHHRTKTPWCALLILITSACSGGSSGGGGGENDSDLIDIASDMPIDPISDPSPDPFGDPGTEPISDPVVDPSVETNLDQGLDPPLPDTPTDQPITEGIVDESTMDAFDTADPPISETGDPLGFDADALGYDGWGTADEGTVCWISGAIGEEVVCDLRVARVSEAILPASGFQFSMSYPSSVTFTGFWDELCIGEFCYDASMVSPDGVDPPSPMSTGHSMSCNPTTVTAFDGSANCVLVHISNPTTALSDAWLAPDEVTVEGDSLILEARFTLNEPLSSSDAAPLLFDNMLGSDEDSRTLNTFVRYDGLILTE